MHWIDILVLVVVGVAIFCGVRRGLVMQLCSLVGIVAAVWASARYGATVGGWLHLDMRYAQLVGFGVVLVGSLVLVTLVGYTLRKIFHLAGLGTTDRLLGALVASLKYLLVLSSIFAAFDYANRSYAFVEESKLEQSFCYRPMCSTAQWLLPYVSRLGGEVYQFVDGAVPEEEKQALTAEFDEAAASVQSTVEEAVEEAVIEAATEAVREQI